VSKSAWYSRCLSQKVGPGWHDELRTMLHLRLRVKKYQHFHVKSMISL